MVIIKTAFVRSVRACVPNIGRYHLQERGGERLVVAVVQLDGEAALLLAVPRRVPFKDANKTKQNKNKNKTNKTENEKSAKKLCELLHWPHLWTWSLSSGHTSSLLA
jgi:hypothetical protein